MRKLAFFLSLMVILSLVLAACGGAAENNQETQTVPTIGATELPDTGLQETETTGGLTTTETTGITGTETTGGPSATETPMVLETSTPPVATTQAPPVSTTQTTGGQVTGTQTAILPPTGMADPSRLTTLLTYDVRNSNDDVLGNVNNMIIDLGTNQILYVLVSSGGFLGIGEKQIPVPYEQMQINSACIETITGSSSTGTSSTGTATITETAVTSTETTITGTETAGSTGAVTTLQPGMDDCYFLLNVNEDVLRNAPNFDRDQMPDINTAGWDTEFNQYWEENATGGTSSTGTAAGTATPGTGTGSTGGSVTATGTATPGAGTDTTGDATAQGNNRLILADELLGINVVAGDATSSTGVTSGSGTSTSGTGSASSTETAVTGATSTATVGGGANGAPAVGEALGTITDAIVDLQTGLIRFYIVTADTAMGSTLNGRLVPIPPQAFGFAAEESAVNQQAVTLKVDDMALSQAPAFDEGTFPNAIVEGWDDGLRNFWSSQGFDSITNP